MRIAYIAAGAAGMYCGSCIHDNTLAAALQQAGVEVALVPTYTPLRTDEDDVSIDQIFYGGINVYLQQKVALFRHTPWVLDRILDRPALLDNLSRFSASTSARDLGALTLSVLRGEQGHQQKELEKLVRWLKEDYRPALVQLTNSMFVGLARSIKKELGVPVLCALQGEDLFLDDLIEPYKTQARAVLRERAQDVDAFIAPCTYYVGVMKEYLQVAAESIHVVRLGLNLQGHGAAAGPGPDGDGPFTIGYLARICPEKGFHLLVEAFHLLTQKLGPQKVRLEVAGYLGRKDRPYFKKEVERLRRWGLEGSFHYRGEVDRQQKIRFLNSLHVLSVPTVYKDPKALFVLEALANGVPVVEPQHGIFSELLQATGGGILVEAHSAAAVAAALLQLQSDESMRRQLGRQGKEAVQRDHSAAVMAAATLEIYREYL